jgi:methylated-DNA-[protein]-cysteine S-methyltransferase
LIHGQSCKLESSRRLKTKWKLETGNWKLETGNWKLETGNWKLEAGSWKLIHMSPFTHTVLAIVRRIPVGRIATYGDVAEAAGRPGAARAVGNIMRECKSRDVPCHRVVAAAGKLGGYGGNLELKRALLRAEGLQVSSSTIRNFSTHRARLRSKPANPGRNRQTPRKPDARKIR